MGCDFKMTVCNNKGGGKIMILSPRYKGYTVRELEQHIQNTETTGVDLAIWTVFGMVCFAIGVLTGIYT